jgi:hypothetical protein
LLFLIYSLFLSCYADGKFDKTPISSHGKPRRTLVLLLSEVAIYLYAYGMYRLADICNNLAKDTEKACAEKAQLRDKPSICPPFIQVLLKRSEVESTWSQANAIVNDEDGKRAFYRLFAVY